MLKERCLKAKDFIPMFTLLNDEDTATRLGFSKPLTVSQVTRYMTVNKDDIRAFEDSHGDFIGYFKLSMLDAVPRVTVAVVREERGKGYATEMCKHVIGLGVECMEAVVLKTNKASIEVWKKCGFKKLPYTNNPEKVIYLYQKGD